MLEPNLRRINQPMANFANFVMGSFNSLTERCGTHQSDSINLIFFHTSELASVHLFCLCVDNVDIITMYT